MFTHTFLLSETLTAPEEAGVGAEREKRCPRRSPPGAQPLQKSPTPGLLAHLVSRIEVNFDSNVKRFKGTGIRPVPPLLFESTNELDVLRQAVSPSAAASLCSVGVGSLHSGCLPAVSPEPCDHYRWDYINRAIRA